MFSRRRVSIVSLLLAVCLLLNGTFSPATAASNPKIEGSRQTAAPVEAQVYADLADYGRADFFIWLNEEADLSELGGHKTKAEKGRYVYETLRETASRSQKDVLAVLDLQGVEYRTFYISNKVLVRAGSLALLETLAARADVERITANHVYQVLSPLHLGPRSFVSPAEVESNISFVKADQVWAMGYTGTGIVLAGNGTGLDEVHPAIARHYRGCLNPPGCTSWDHNYNWWDATDTYPLDPADPVGHGTMTTGVMVGDDGASNQIGMAPGAQTIHCKTLTDGGSTTDEMIIECMMWDLAPWDLTGANPDPSKAPDAVNNPWGYFGGGEPQFLEEIQALVAAGIVVEFSAGGEGPGCSTIRSPADYVEVIATGSANHDGIEFPGILSPFSARGPSPFDPDGFKPNVVAPGDNIRSSFVGGGYQVWSGTSMSGSHVTGLIGLIWQAGPTLQGDVLATMELIQDTAAPLTGQNGSNCGGDYTDGPNNDWGWGTIDALAAVNAALAYPAELEVTPASLASILDWGTNETLELQLINTGMTSIDWDISEEVEAPWLSVDPSSGTAPGGDTVSVLVTFDASQVPGAGDYFTNLIVDTDPYQEPITVPVTLTVIEPSAGVILSPEVVFGSGTPGETITYTLSVSNTGSLTDTYDLTATDVPAGWVVSLLPAVTVPAGQSVGVDIAVTVPLSAAEGTYDLTVTATSQMDPTATDSSTLTTTVDVVWVYLPVVFKGTPAGSLP